MFTPAWKHRPQSHNQPLSIHPLVLCPRTFTGLVAMSSIAGRLNGPDRPAIESFSGLLSGCTFIRRADTVRRSG